MIAPLSITAAGAASAAALDQPFGQPLDQLGQQAAPLCAAFGLCLLLGLERHVHLKDAGIKTHVLVGVGACLFTLVSAYGFGAGSGTGTSTGVDPSRIAAQVVSGIGFLGAGVIFVNNDTVRGLTTAATVWLSAAVGMACGASMIQLASLTLALHDLLVFDIGPLVRLMPQRGGLQAVEVEYEVGNAVMPAVISAATSLGYTASISSTSSRRTEQGKVMTARMAFKGGKDAEALVHALAGVDGVVGVVAVDASRLD